MALSDIAPIASIGALAISLFTLWFTILRRGTIRSTHPNLIVFRYDYVGQMRPQAKIFLRTLLLSTGKRGQVIESLFLRVRDSHRHAEFSFWALGDKDLVRGSGLFVPESGVVNNHHFNPIHTDDVFYFHQGRYSLELMAKLLGHKGLVSLWEIELDIPDDISTPETSVDQALFFNWSPEQMQYITTIEARP